MKKILVLFIVLSSIIGSVTAQTYLSPHELKLILKNAKDMTENEKYEGAIVLYERLLNYEPENPLYHYHIAYCYMNSKDDKEKAPSFFRKAIENINEENKKSIPNDIYYNYIKSYQMIYEFDVALLYYEKYKKYIVDNKKLNKKTEKLLRVCKNGSLLKKNPVDLNVHSLGPKINSNYSDHSPVISADESVIIFTSRRQGGMGKRVSEKGEFTEDIYVATNEMGQWTNPKNIGSTINTIEHEASIGLSPDGQKLFIYKADGNNKGDIFESTLIGEFWSEPAMLLPGIISKKRSRETHASITADGSAIYFTSDRKGGFGGLDIYRIMKLPNGEWGLPQNLGPSINTSGDEKGPYIHPDGITLYFSSEQHNTLGGFDIFYSVYKPESFNWSRAKNIGYPINTVDNDMYFILTADGQRAYYSTYRKDSYGKADLYLINLNNAEDKNISVITGYVKGCNNTIPDVFINVINEETSEIAGMYRPNIKSGKYLFVLPKNHSYSVEYINADTLANQKSIYLNSGSPNLIKLDTLKFSCPEDKRISYNGEFYDYQIFIKDILFPSGKAQIEKSEELEKIADYLLKYPYSIIQIAAYADATGTKRINEKLTKKRAKFVKRYLIKLNVKSNQIRVIGCGSENPIAINYNPDGSNCNEGQELNRRIEFKMIVQGQKKLVIRPLQEIAPSLKHPNYDPNYLIDAE